MKFSEDIRGRGELELLHEELFTEPFREIFTGLRSVNYISSAYIDNIEEDDFRRYVSTLRSNAVYNTTFPDLIKALRDKRGLSPQQPLTINAADVVTRPVPWLIDNFLVRGALNGFQGVQGEGKSWLTASLVCAVADGGEWLADSGDMQSVSQGRVLLANFDDDVSYTMVPRLMYCGISSAGLKNVDILNRSACIGMDFADERLGVIFEKYKPDLAIFDTMQHFIGAKTDMYRANDVNAMLSNIQNLAEKYDTAVIIVEHITKQAASGNGGHSVNWGLGSVAIAGLFRTLWTIGELRNLQDGKYEPRTRAIVCSKANLMKDKPPAKLYRISNGLVWCGIDDISAFDLLAPDKKRGRPSEQSDRAEEIIRELLADGEMKSDDLEKAVLEYDISTATYKRARKAVGVKSHKREGTWYSCL
jgi:hypothetical protein